MKKACVRYLTQAFDIHGAEAGIEPARPYERGILSPVWKSIKPYLLIGFPVRNQPQLLAMQANASACLGKIADQKNP